MKKTGVVPRLAARARALEVSPTVAMAAKARALKAKGVKVYDFRVGEPDQPTPRHVAEAGKAAIDAGQTQLRARRRHARAARGRGRALPRRLRRVVRAGGGGDHASAASRRSRSLCQALLDRGSEVVIPIPAWPTFAEAARLAGGTPVFVPLHVEDGFRVTASAVARKVGPKTRAVMVNSPSNPTGAVIDPAELREARRASRSGAASRCSTTTPTPTSCSAATGSRPSLQEVKDAAGGRLVVVGTASKSYCMTGWRIGWILGPKALVDAATALNSHSVQGPATFAQVAAAQALTGPQDEVRRMLAEYRRRRDFIHPRIAGIPGVVCPRPEGGFYVFPDVSRCLSKALPDTLALGAKLLEEKAVAVVPGEGFQAPGTFRLSFATAFEDLQEGARRIEAFFAEHAPPRPGRR